MSQHTPGPWISDATHKVFPNHVIRKNGVVIAIIPHVTTMDPDEKWANARLIKEAPAMYEFVLNLSELDHQCAHREEEECTAGCGCVPCDARALLALIEGA